MFTLLFASFLAVLLAEVVGDKTLWTTTTLAGAHRAGPVAVGAAVAAALKMGVAVAFGHLLADLPGWLLTTTSVVAWAAIAFSLWRSARAPTTTSPPIHGVRLAGTSFVAVFLTEWGDPGQVTAGLLAAQTGEPVVVWAAGVGAMIVKIAAGISLTQVARRWLQPRAWRRAGAAVFVVFGVLALFSVT